MGHFGHFTLFNYPRNQQFDKYKNTNFIILLKCTKSHTHMVDSYQEMMPTSVQAIQAPLCPFYTFWSKKTNFWKIKKIPGDIIILHHCTKNGYHMIFTLQIMKWIVLRVILGHFCLLLNFWPKKSKLLKKRKNA